jgi:1,4-dihydroxy-2-naphthoate octaprenyltransferase
MQIYKALIWSNILMALDAAGWTGLTFNALNIAFDWFFIALSFAFTWLFYTYDRMHFTEEDQLNNPERTAWYQRQTYLKPLLNITTILLIGFVALRPAIILPVAIGIIPCVLYAKPLKLGGYRFSLKALPGMKAYLVAFLWVLLTVYFPIISTNSPLPQTLNIFNYSLMVAFFIMLQISTNDLRDIKGDNQANIKSFAVILGDKKARLLGLLFIVFGVYLGYAIFHPILLFLFALLLALRTVFYKKEHDIYWQFFISIQGFLAFLILK